MNKYDWGLINKKYTTIKEEQPDLMDEMREDLEFYKKRIYQATKELTKNQFDQTQYTIKDAYIEYVKLLINHFKLEDTRELVSQQLETIFEEDENEDIIMPSNITPDEITKQFLIRREKPSVIRIEDCFNVFKAPGQEELKPNHIRRVVTPSINIRQDKFREKGVKKRPTYLLGTIYETNPQTHAQTSTST